MGAGDQTPLSLGSEELPVGAVAAVIYAAKSTDDRHGSVPRQLEECERMCERNGWHVVEKYHDVGFSAFHGNRGPGLEQAMRHAAALAAERGHCMLVAQHSDRFARGAGDRPGASRHLSEIWHALRRVNVQPRSVQDDSTFSDEIHVVLAGRRNYEDSKRKQLAVRGGKRAAFQRGDWTGGPAPDGYVFHRRFAERGRIITDLVVDANRAPVIRELFQLAKEGHGDPTIARRLGAKGFLTKSGKPFSRRRVQDTITNPVYAGANVWHRGRPDQEIDWRARHEAFIDVDTFLSLADARVRRDRTVGSTRPRGGRPTTRYLLSKLAQCDRCGTRMWSQSSTYERKDGTRARWYVCANVHGETGLCDAPRIDADRVDGVIRRCLHNMVENFDEYVSLVLGGRDDSREALEAARDAVLTELDQLDDRQKLLEEDLVRRVYEKQTAAADAIADALDNLKRQRLTVQARLRDAQRELEAIASPPPEEIMLNGFAQHRRLLRRLESETAVVVANEELRRHFRAIKLDLVDGRHLGVEPVLRADSPLLRFHGDQVETERADDAASNGVAKLSIGSVQAAGDPEGTGNLSQEPRPVSTNRWFPRFEVALDASTGATRRGVPGGGAAG